MTLPVTTQLIEAKSVAGGLDALLSIAQMPGGVPVGTLAIGSHGAKNAALLAIRILANSRPELREKLRKITALFEGAATAGERQAAGAQGVRAGLLAQGPPAHARDHPFRGRWRRSGRRQRDRLADWSP